MNALFLHLHLCSPLLITGANGGDVNSEQSLPYIPGSVLRGVLAGLYPGARDAANSEFHHLFLSGAVRYLNGYPADGSGQRTLPTPLSWQQAKDGTDDIYDLAVKHPDGEHQWRRVGENFPFCLVQRPARQAKGEEVAEPEATPAAHLFAPTPQVDIHIARTDRQRPTAAGATVFRYESLAAGQRFVAVVVADQAGDLEKLQALVQPHQLLGIGRSRSAQYGRVEVEAVEISAQAWHETAAPATTSSGAQVIVTLLSDAIVRDPVTGAYASSLAAVAGPAEAAFIHTRVAGGFNHKWNLPLPQAQAIGAGSVFVYPAAARSRLADLVEHGIGERTCEGFGRIALDWQQDEKLILPAAAAATAGAAAAAAKPGVTPVLTSSDSQRMARAMLDRLVRAALDRRLLAALSRHRLEPRRVSNSQLARVRVIVRDSSAPEAQAEATHADQLTLLKEYLAHAKRAAREPLERARIDKQSFLEWLQRLAQQPAQVWLLLIESTGDGAAPADDELVKRLDLPALGTLQGADLVLADPTYRIEYALRLIDGVVRKAIKEANHG